MRLAGDEASPQSHTERYARQREAATAEVVATLESAGDAEALGQFQAGQLKADLGSRTVVLEGGARLKIVQGGVR